MVQQFSYNAGAHKKYGILCLQLLGKANWIIVGTNCWRREREVTFVRLAYAAHNILNYRLNKDSL